MIRTSLSAGRRKLLVALAVILLGALAGAGAWSQTAPEKDVSTILREASQSQPEKPAHVTPRSQKWALLIGLLPLLSLAIIAYLLRRLGERERQAGLHGERSRAIMREGGAEDASQDTDPRHRA